MIQPASIAPPVSFAPSSSFRSYRRDGYWFFQLAEGIVFGPFDTVVEAEMGDRKCVERELDERETARLLLEFA